MKICRWFSLILGLWILISPWTLGFSSFDAALWSNIVAGVLIVICALWELFGYKNCNQCGKHLENII